MGAGSGSVFGVVVVGVSIGGGGVDGGSGAGSVMSATDFSVSMGTASPNAAHALARSTVSPATITFDGRILLVVAALAPVPGGDVSAQVDAQSAVVAHFRLRSIVVNLHAWRECCAGGHSRSWCTRHSDTIQDA